MPFWSIASETNRRFTSGHPTLETGALIFGGFVGANPVIDSLEFPCSVVIDAGSRSPDVRCLLRIRESLALTIQRVGVERVGGLESKSAVRESRAHECAR